MRRLIWNTLYWGSLIAGWILLFNHSDILSFVGLFLILYPMFIDDAMENWVERGERAQRRKERLAEQQLELNDSRIQRNKDVGVSFRKK